MMRFFLEINTWEWIRVLGLLAYFYFTMSVVFGILGRFSFAKSKKFLIYNLHMSSAWMGIFMVIGHMLILIIDHYEPYKIVEIVIPFAADYHPILSGIGTISFYLFLLVMVTSDLLMKKIKRPVWKKIHYFVFPAWLFTLLHSLFIGTDTSNPVIAMFYGATSILVLFLILLKLLDKPVVKKTTTRSAPTSEQSK